MKIFIKWVIAIVATLLIWEAIISSLVLKLPNTIQHKDFGTIYSSGLLVNGREGYVRTTLNSVGWRHMEVIEKPASVKRILVLGDSYTEAIQVSDDKTYSSLLEVRLKASGMNIEVINAGRSGASPADYIKLAPLYMNMIEPDEVIVQLNEKDFSDDLFNSNSNYYLTKIGSELSIQKNENRKALATTYLSRYSTLKIINQRVISLRSKWVTELQQPQDEARPIHISTIEWTLINLVKSYPNIKLIYIPDIDYFNINKPISDIEKNIDLLAAENNMELINMRKRMTLQYSDTHQPSHGFNNTTPGYGHLNALGHQLVTEQLLPLFGGK